MFEYKTELEKKIARSVMKVEKPARYIGGELNAIRKPDDEVSMRVAFAFPDMYEIGMSNLGIQILYKALNDIPDVQCERTYAPDVDFEAIMREEGIPLYTLETKRAVKDADIFAISVGYEMLVTNVLNMIDLAGMEVYAKEHGYKLSEDSWERYVTDCWTTKNEDMYVTEVRISATR